MCTACLSLRIWVPVQKGRKHTEATGARVIYGRTGGEEENRAGQQEAAGQSAFEMRY